MRRTDAAAIEGAMKDPLLAATTDALIGELQTRFVGMVLSGLDTDGATHLRWSGPMPLILGLREMLELQIETLLTGE